MVSALSKLMNMCGSTTSGSGGLQSAGAEIARTDPIVSRRTRQPRVARTESGREVQIDRATSIPEELFKDLMLAGEEAKFRGQHSLLDEDSPSGKNVQRLVIQRRRSA